MHLGVAADMIGSGPLGKGGSIGFTLLHQQPYMHLATFLSNQFHTLLEDCQPSMGRNTRPAQWTQTMFGQATTSGKPLKHTFVLALLIYKELTILVS